MRLAHWETHYCHEVGCPGCDGFEVRWSGDTDTDPSEPNRDTCPHCGREMHDHQLFWRDAAETAFETAKDNNFEVPGVVDLVALAAAIQAELRRQADAERHQRAVTAVAAYELRYGERFPF